MLTEKERKKKTAHSFESSKNRSRLIQNEQIDRRPTVNKKKKKRKHPVPKMNTKSKIFIFVWNIFFYVLMFLLLSGSILMAAMQQQDKSLYGYRMFGVLTNSMVSPNNELKPGGFRAGDILIIHEVPKEKIKVGDVITYRPSTNPTNKSTNYLTHRVVKINDRLGEEKGVFFVTRGDANKTDDMPISGDALVGKEMFRVPIIGGILAFIRENWLVSLIFIGSIIGFVWVVRIYIVNNPTTKKRRKKKKNKKRSPKQDISSSEVNINKKKKHRRKHK